MHQMDVVPKHIQQITSESEELELNKNALTHAGKLLTASPLTCTEEVIAISILLITLVHQTVVKISIIWTGEPFLHLHHHFLNQSQL